MRILVVEDERVLGAAVAERLRQAGHALDLFETLADARVAFRAFAHDFVLLDLSLRDGDGRVFLREIRAANAAIAIVITTAMDQISNRIGRLSDGADDYLVKPFDFNALSARIVAGVTVVVLAGLIGLGIKLAAFTRVEVTQRLDDSLRGGAERSAVAASDWRRVDVAAGMAAVTRVPNVDRRTFAYQVFMPDGSLALRSQNAPERPFTVPLRNGFYDQPNFRVYVARSQANQQIILAGEPSFHCHQAVRQAMLLTLAPLVVFFLSFGDF